MWQLKRLSTISISTGIRHFSREMNLIQNKTLVNGAWIQASSNKTFDVLNPVNGEIVGAVPDMDVNDAKSAIQAAHTSFHSDEWQKKTVKDRSNMLKVIPRKLNLKKII